MSTFVGIDIGAHAIQVCTSDGKNKEIPLTGEWPSELLKLTGEKPIVGVEPTGGHYSMPVLRVLDQAEAVILQVDHSTSKRFRQTHVSIHKTDAIDAQALMLVAQAHVKGDPIRGVKQIFPGIELMTVALRATILAYRRAVKEATRTQNRIKQMAYQAWPALAQSLPTYSRAVGLGYVSIADLRTLSERLDIQAKLDRDGLPGAYHHGAARNALKKLINRLPRSIDMPDIYRELIFTEHEVWKQNEDLKFMLEEELKNIIHHPLLWPVTRLWMTVPAFDVYTLAALHAATHCKAQAFTPDMLRGVIGFFPQHHHSGDAKNDKQPMFGYKPARHGLHMWAVRLVQPHCHNPVIRYYRKKQDEGHRFPFQAARGKLARILIGIARSGEPCTWPDARPLPDDPKPAPPPFKQWEENQWQEQQPLTTEDWGDIPW